MAFQATAGLQSMASATGELWPSISTVVQTPWRALTRQAPSTVSSKSSRQIHTERTPDTVTQLERDVRSTLELPEFLRGVSLSALQFRPSAEALKIVPTVGNTLLAVPQNALRFCSPLSRSLPQKMMLARQYSTVPQFLRTANLRSVPRPGSVGLALAQQRSVFGASSSRNLLAHLESTANNNPSSATAQNALYSALLRANMPEILVERYQTGHYATNPACEAIYIKALERVGQAEKAQAMQSVKDSQGHHTTISAEQMQAIGQAVGSRVRGGNVSVARTGSGDKTSPLYVVVEESTGSTVFKWIKFLLYFGLVTYISLIVITLMIEASGMLKKVGGTQNTEARPELQTTRFSDVHGCEEAKEELQELVDFLKDPEKFSTLGGRLPKGVLLVGPPGTGKTLLARAVAGEAGVPFFYMSGSEFDEVYVGVGAKRVRELFSAARAKAPAIVFIDELDAIGGKRNERDAAYVKQTLNQLLTDLDGFDQNSGVIFLAATNFPQLLDKALTRPGRFDRNVTVPLPDVRGRVAILKHHMKNVQLSTDVDASILARGTSGFSGAELENVVNQAAVHASKQKKKKVDMIDFEWAKDKIMMGAESRSRVIQEKDKIATAYHEGGHTLVALYTKGADPLYKATVMPRGHALGITFMLPGMDEVSRTKRQYQASLDVSMGGKAAEELIYGDDEVSSGASSDIENATNIAYAMVTSFGMSEKLGNVDLASQYSRLSSETKTQIENEVRRLLEEAKKRAKDLLIAKRNELDLLAKALVEHETLNKDEIEKVVKGEKIPNKLLAGSPSAPIKLPEMLLPGSLKPSGSDGDEPGTGVPGKPGPGVYTGSG